MQSNSGTDVLMVEQDGTGYSLHAVGNTSSAIYAETTSQNASTNYTILSVNRAPGGTGLRSEAQANTGHGFGVMGVSFGDTGTGVYGENSRLTGTTYGVRGKSLSDSGIGVFGTNLSPTGSTVGSWAAPAARREPQRYSMHPTAAKFLAAEQPALRNSDLTVREIL